MKKFPSIIVLVIALCQVACIEDTQEREVPRFSFPFPTGLAVHSEGYALIGCSNFDLWYSHGVLRAIDLNQLAKADIAKEQKLDPWLTRFILEEQTIGIANFAGSVKLSSDQRKAGVAIREKGELVLLDVEVREQINGDKRLTLNCWQNENRPEEDYPFCDHTYRVKMQDADPYDILFFDKYSSEQGKEAQRTAFVTYLRSGDVAAVDISYYDKPTLKYTLETKAQSCNDLALALSSGLIYVTGSAALEPSIYLHTNPLMFFDPKLDSQTDVESVNVFEEFLGAKTQSIAFASNGTTAGLLVSDPDMLVFLDTSLDESAQPINKFLGAVVVCSSPSRVRAYKDLMFVTCAKDDALYVIDAVTRKLIGVREDICVTPFDEDNLFGGPFDIAFYDSGSTRPVWGIVSCFEDGTIAIINADRDSPEFLDVIAHVGVPASED